MNKTQLIFMAVTFLAPWACRGMNIPRSHGFHDLSVLTGGHAEVNRSEPAPEVNPSEPVFGDELRHTLVKKLSKLEKRLNDSRGGGWRDWPPSERQEEFASIDLALALAQADLNEIREAANVNDPETKSSLTVLQKRITEMEAELAFLIDMVKRSRCEIL